MNKGDRNVPSLSQFKNSYGKVRVELGFFQVSFFFNFWLCRSVMRMRHGLPEIKMQDDLGKIMY